MPLVAAVFLAAILLVLTVVACGPHSFLSYITTKSMGAQLVQSPEKATQDLDTAVEAMEATLQNATMETKALQTANAKLRAEMADLKTEMQDLTKAFLANESLAASQHAKEVEAMRQKLDEEIAGFQEEIANLTTARDMARRELEESNVKHATEIGDCKSALANVKQTKEAQLEDIAGFQEEIANLTTDRDMALKEIEESNVKHATEMGDCKSALANAQETKEAELKELEDEKTACRSLLESSIESLFMSWSRIKTVAHMTFGIETATLQLKFHLKNEFVN